jgi:hypothetical protein
LIGLEIDVREVLSRSKNPGVDFEPRGRVLVG